MISPECYVARKPSSAMERKLKEYPGCYWYLGGLLVRASYPEFDGTLTSVSSIVSRAREVQGSNSSPTAILAGMKGYSGLTDEFGKRMQFVLGSVLGLWAQNRKVVIRVDSVGDVTMLVSSLNLWAKRIRDSASPLFVVTEGDQEKKVSCHFKIMLSRDVDKQNLNVRYHEYVVSAVEPDAVIVYHHVGSLPTAASKGQIVDFDLHSQSLIPPHFDGQEYVMYGPIYGFCPFANDFVVKRAAANAMTRLTPWKRTPTVYAFGTASNFHGILTTMKNFSLIGWGLESTGPNKWDERETKFVEIGLFSYGSQKDWYNKVAVDVKAVTVAWLNPISRYSPISNLPYVSKAGVTFALERVQSEEGVLIGNILAVPSQGKTVVDELVSRFVKEEAQIEDVEESLFRTPVTRTNDDIALTTTTTVPNGQEVQSILEGVNPDDL